MNMKKIFALILLLGNLAHAKLMVVATTTDLSSIAKEVGGNLIEVESIAKGTQDPHFIEAKPSFMLRSAHADLLISVGLDLEIGWLPNIIRGARNPKINPGNDGFLEIGESLQTLEKPTGDLSRAQGDVHPQGNPHVTLDPIRAGQIAMIIAERLAKLNPENAALFQKNGQIFSDRLKSKTELWKKRIIATGISKVVTYHKTLTYFLDRFAIQNAAILEPKPGIPPTSGHILDVTQIMKKQNIKLVLIENYFDPSIVKKIQSIDPGVRSEIVPVSVDGEKAIGNLDELYETLVQAVEGKK